MELAIPLIALGGMYVISNQNNKKEQIVKTQKKENFDNMGIRTNLQEKNIESRFNNYLPNTNVPAENYPIMNNKELIDNVQEYPNPNVATDKYFNQNLYKEKERLGEKLGSNIQEVYSLTGNYMDSKEFLHNNMVPFNGGKPKGQIYNNNNAENILDNYAGTGSQVIKKIEQAPLFKPQENVQWQYGMQNMSDFYQSRVNPVNKNNMVKPFESIRVGPGLDKGYSTEGSLGYNSGMEARDKWLPKTVDELRISTNPKVEYSLDNLQGPASSMIKNIGIEGKMEKNRPDTFFINTQDRWLTTTGSEKAGQMIPEHIIKNVTRNETSTYQQGTPNAILKTASYVPKKYEETKRKQLEGFDVGPSVATKICPHYEDKSNYHNSHTNYENNRSMNKNTDIFGSGFSSAIGAAIAPIMDILKPSRKEEYTCNMRIYGNMSGEVPGNYVLEKSDIPDTTIKETTLYSPNGYVGNQKDNGAYMIANNVPIKNQRDTTTDVFCLNPAGSKYGNRKYDGDYRQNNNETKEKLVHARINQGNTNYFNSNINVSMSKIDSDRENNRLWAPQSVIASGPSVQTYGRTNIIENNKKDEYINNDRLSGDLLKAFKENPFTHSLHSVA